MMRTTSCLDDLLLIGASVQGTAPLGDGPTLRYSAPEAFARAKQSRKALCAFLHKLPAEPQVREAFVWDTCQRVEFYGWWQGSVARAEAAAADARIARALFGDPPEGLEVYRLGGERALYHLLRTACGLNSRLPGDLDVTAQLETAIHLARSAGAAGGLAQALLAEVLDVIDEVSGATAWGDFRSGYCRAALQQLAAPDTAGWETRTHVVIGGSTTSRSIIDALVGTYHVPQPRITLVYRGHHGQWKLLRQALGSGRRLRVQDYTDRQILQAIAAADVVFFGLDVAGPVLMGPALGALRSFAERPLTLIDFNSLGSVGGSLPDGITLWRAPQLDAAVSAHAAGLRRRTDFRRAAEAADERLRRAARLADSPLLAAG